MTDTNLPVAGTKIVEYSATAAGLADLRHRLAGVVFDVKTKDGMAAARAGRRECIDLRVKLEKLRKELKAPALERSRLIDDEAQTIEDQIREVEEPIDQQIKVEDRRVAEEQAERERQEANRIAQIVAKVNAIERTPLTVAGKAASEVEAALQRLRERPTDQDEFAEYTIQARELKAAALATLSDMVAQYRANETEKARLAEERAALEKREREAELRRKAQRMIDDLHILPAKYQGMPAADIEHQIRVLGEAKAEVTDEAFGSIARKTLQEAGLFDDWLKACDAALGTLRAHANLSRTQEQQAAEAKAKAERQEAERAIREDIAAIRELPASLIDQTSGRVALSREQLRIDLQAYRGEGPLSDEWRKAATESLARLDKLFEDKRSAEDRAAQAAEQERAAKEYAAREDEERKATAEAIPALERIAALAADLKGCPDPAIARSRMGGIASGTLYQIELAKSAKRKRKVEDIGAGTAPA